MSSIYLVLDMENDLVHENGPNATGPFSQQMQLQIMEKFKTPSQLRARDFRAGARDPLIGEADRVVKW